MFGIIHKSKLVRGKKAIMKKFIISMLAMAFMVLGASTFAYADTTLNQPGSMPTLTVSNATLRPCNMGPIDGCWTTSTSARPGDIITVHIYYKNTGGDLSRGTTLSIKPQSTGVVSSVTFTGGVASLTAPRAVGSARVSLTSPATVTYRSGSARWYPYENSPGRSVDPSGLFGSSGFNIGTIAPGDQGVLTADFVVGSTVVNDQCEIDSFTADDYSIDSGDSTKLRWSTTDCDYVNITSVGSRLNPDGSASVSPTSTKTYTLTAYPGGATRTVRINVNEKNVCSINSFSADSYTLTNGQSTVLRWSTTGMDSVDITPGYSNRAESGSVTISPSVTTTYTLTGDNCSNSRSITVTVGQAQTLRPQAVTTTATILSSNSARLNGIGFPNTTVGTTSMWFEWGPTTSLGYRTSTRVIASNNTSNPYNDFVSGLVPGTTYWYRAVVQNQNGLAYGEIVRFQTTRVVQTTVVTTPPPRVIVQPAVVQTSQVVQDVVVAQSAPSLLELRVESLYDRMCIGGQMDYTVTYRNISGQTLENAVLRFTHPKEVTYISSTRGEYEVIDRVITIALGDIRAGEEGVITIRTRINDTAVRGNLTVTTATVVYTNSITRAQEDAIAYSLITVSDDCPNVLGASVFGFGSFLPDTLLEWLLLILVILALILLGRQLYRKREQTTIITQ
jgi:hypothetical protein